jgi:serine/threonine-protein kinase HipA
VEAHALTPEIPLQAGKISIPAVHAFFENLLPEGDQRRLISVRYPVSSVFGLLSIIGGDTPGCTALLPVGQRQLLRWLFFNLYVGNNDSHAKNLSILATPDGPRLAPFYDLMSTRVYAGLGRQFAFRIGGENLPGKIGAPQVQLLAQALDIAPKYLLSIAGDMARKVEAAVRLAANEIGHDLSPSDMLMVERLQLKIVGIVKQMGARIL